MDKLPRPGYRIEGIPAEITRRQTSKRQGATEESSTVVAFPQEDFLGLHEPESAIDIDSQKGKPNPFKEVLTNELNKILDVLNRSQLRPITPKSRRRLARRIGAALGVGQFVKECARQWTDYELIGLADTVEAKARALERIVPAEEWMEDAADATEYENDTSGEADENDPSTQDEEWLPFNFAGTVFGVSQKYVFQVLKILGYVTGDSAYAEIVPTDKAAELFKQSDKYRGLLWSKELIERVDAELGPAGFSMLVGELIKQEEDADWEKSEWVLPSQLARRIPPLQKHTINKVLEAAGYQVKKGTGWCATEKAAGLSYQEGLRTGNPRILWKKEMLDRIEKHLNPKADTEG